VREELLTKARTDELLFFAASAGFLSRGPLRRLLLVLRDGAEALEMPFLFPRDVPGQMTAEELRPSLSPLKAEELKAAFRDPAGDPVPRILKDHDLLLSLGFSENGLSLLSGAAADAERLREEREDLETRGIRFMTQGSPGWAARLDRIPDPPLWLYVRGALPDDGVPSVSIVGSRGASLYGLRMAEFIAGELARKKVQVISGMAAGIDGAAHAEALREGGLSYALLGCGVNICYPKEHFEMFEAMAEGGRGGVISEYPPDSPPQSYHFPERNRLIAGLSDCLVVTESRGCQSGTSITVGHALDQGKQVFCVPGRLTDPMSRGCNDLIRTGASILTGPDCVLDALGILHEGALVPRKKKGGDLSREERLVYRLLDAEPRYLEEIVRKSGLAPGKVMSILLKLEVSGLAVQTSGSCYAAVYRRKRARVSS